MDRKPRLIVTTVAVIFASAGVLSHCQGRTAGMGYGVSHVLRAITSGLVTRFALARSAIKAIRRAE